MFGVGAQEMLLIGLLCLLVFGPGKFSGMARDLGGFVRKVMESTHEFKAELSFDGDQVNSWEGFGDLQEEIEGQDGRGFGADEESEEASATGPRSRPEAPPSGSSGWRHEGSAEEPWPEHVVAVDVDEEGTPTPAHAP